MPLCGFNEKMIEGLAIFAKGLFEAVQDRAAREGLSLEKAFDNEIHELGLFLASLEEKYQHLRANHSAAVTMRRLVDEMPKRS